MKPSCFNKCRLGCSQKFDEQARSKIFKDFWVMISVEKQCNYIAAVTTSIVPKYRYVREGATTWQTKSQFCFSLQ